MIGPFVEVGDHIVGGHIVGGHIAGGRADQPHASVVRLEVGASALETGQHGVVDVDRPAP
jgi:hypothetical protein